MKKATTSLLIILLLIGGAAWYYVSFRLDDAIANGIEEAGSAAFGTSVKVGGVKTSIRDGTLSISSITVANPPGYTNKFAISLNAIEAAVDYDSYEIKRVIIDKPEVVIEEKGGQTNFSDLLVNIQSDRSEPAADADPDADGKDGTDTDATTIVIRHFRMNQTRASFESKSLDRYSDLKVDEIEMNNISGTPAEVASLIATRIIQEITAEAAIEMFKAKLRKKFDKLEIKVNSRVKGWFGDDDEEEDENDSDR